MCCFLIKGISFHITCIVFEHEKNLTTQTFVHIFEETNQDVDAVIGIVDSVFGEIKSQFGPKVIFIRFDNAGCYHNQTLVTILNFLGKKYTHKVVRLDFNEPSAGKDICDRKIAPIRRIIQNYIDNGNDVLTAYDLKKAIDSNSSLQGVKTLVCNMNNSLDFKNDFKFPSITNFHSFSYEKDYLLAFRYYNIGTGKKIYYKDLVKIDINEMMKKLDKASLVIVQKQNVNNHYMYAPKSSNMKMFKCDKCELFFTVKTA